MTEHQIGFGDYVVIEMNRYGVPNEMYVHKVINTLVSNTWVDVPVISIGEETIHSEYADVASCICCGICETKVMKYRICDVEKCVP